MVQKIINTMTEVRIVENLVRNLGHLNSYKKTHIAKASKNERIFWRNKMFEKLNQAEVFTPNGEGYIFHKDILWETMNNDLKPLEKWFKTPLTWARL